MNGRNFLNHLYTLTKHFDTVTAMRQNPQLAEKAIGIVGIKNDHLCTFLQRSIQFEQEILKAQPDIKREIELMQAIHLLQMISPPS